MMQRKSAFRPLLQVYQLWGSRSKPSFEAQNSMSTTIATENRNDLHSPYDLPHRPVDQRDTGDCRAKPECDWQGEGFAQEDQPKGHTDSCPQIALARDAH